MPYDLFEHRHRFAVWAAARATQRAFAKATVEVLRDALEHCGVKEFLSANANTAIDADAFREHHRRWCRAIIANLTDAGISDPTFGRAAKLVAVYLKTMIVLGPLGDCDLAQVAHPPIDSILLQGISKATDIASPNQRAWGKVRWTQLTEDRYYSLIDQLRTAVANGEPFWTLERFWTVSSGGEE
jgi:hypothetical protein